MKRRGFVFTLDVLLALMMVTMFVTSIVAVTLENSVYSTHLRSQSKYIAEDTLMMLRTTPLSNLVPPSVIENWTKNGILNTSLVNPNMDPLDIAATYWAVAPIFNNKTIEEKFKNNSAIILGYILNQTLPGYYYQLFINNWTNPYLNRTGSAYLNALDVSPATLVMSGYAYNQTPRGYMARAYLTKIGSKTTSYVYTGMEYEAYGYSTDENTPIIARMRVPNEQLLPSDANITAVKWWPYVDPIFGGSVQLYIDGEGVTCGQYKAGEWVEVEKQENLYDNSLNNSCNMLDIIKHHNDRRYHVFEVREYDTNDVIGPFPQFITLTYTTSQLSTFKYPKITYFDNFSSYYLPMWVGKHVFIPGNLTDFEVSIQLRNLPSDTTATLYINNQEVSTISPNSNGIFYWSNSTIASKINYNELSGKYAFVEIYISSDSYDRSFNEIDPPVQVVYSNSSYIKVDYGYSSGLLLTPYSVDLTLPIDENNIVSFSGCGSQSGGLTLCKSLEWRYQIPDDNSVTPVWTKMYFDAYFGLGLGQGTMEVKIKNNDLSGWSTIYQSSNGLWYFGIPKVTTDVNSEIIDPAISKGDNYIEVDLTGDYRISKEFSQGSTTYLLQAYAGYDKVFPKYIRDGCTGYNITYYWDGDSNPHYILAGEGPNYCKVSAQDLLNGCSHYAVDDAIIRLFNNIGGDGTRSSPILIELPENVNIDLASMGQIPGLFQPIQITLRVWRGD